MRPILLTLAFALTLPLAGQSPMFRGDRAHTGVYPAPAKPIEGKIAWSYEALGWDRYQKLEAMDGRPVWPVTPAVVEGRIYFCAGPSFVVLDEAGKLLYRTELGARSLASPAVAGGLVFVATDDGKSGRWIPRTARCAGPRRSGGSGFCTRSTTGTSTSRRRRSPTESCMPAARTAPSMRWRRAMVS